MGMGIRMTGRGVLAAAVMVGLAGLGVAAPAMASSRTVPGRAAGAARVGGHAVPGFASGIIPSARAGLGNLSCPTASFCVAVGGYFDSLYQLDPRGPHGHSLAEEWNGRSWRIMPGVSGAAGVSCTSARFCVAVGGGPIQRWDGRRWTAVRTPSGVTPLNSVSCLSTSFCMAIGSNGDGCYSGAVWHGAAWDAVTVPGDACGVGDAGLGSVSCASPSDCIAVGGTDGDEHIGVAQAVGWNGKTWQVLGLPTGNASDSWLFGVSCPSTSFCMAVGNTFAGNLALAWNGSSWTELTTPPSGVSGVWCAGAKSCVAVGGDQALTWNGAAWAGRTISQPQDAGLGAVSCWRPSACMAAGSYSRMALPGQPRGQLTLAERWNGSSWKVLRTPSPGDEQEGLSGVSCPSAANCMAVGAFVNGSDVQAALAERWNGRTWKVLGTPDPGPRENVLTSVSCPATRQCIAVGYFDAAGGLAALAEQWNGSTWTTLPVPHSGVLNGVSCPAPGDCVAVGTYVSGGVQQTLSVFWNGSTWTVKASPAPSSSLAEFNAVACPSRTGCIAVGDYHSVGRRLVPLTARWNGHAWTMLTAPAPGGTYADNSLTSVSCSRPRSCMAVGRTFRQGGFLSHALAESWDGTRWTVRPTTRLKIKIVLHLNAVSCSAPAGCLAAGGYLSPAGDGFVLAEAWNGATWRRLLPITDPSTAFTDLYAISCPTDRHCIAVGGTEIQHTLAYLWNGTGWQRLQTPNP